MNPNRVLSGLPYPWVVVALCVLATMFSSTFRQGMGVLFPFIQDELEISRAELGLIAAGLSIGGTASSLLGGWLADAVGVRRLQTLSLAGTLVGVLLFSQMQSLLQAVLLALVIGIFLSASFPACAKAIMDWVTPRTRGLTIGLAEASIPVSGIIAALLIPFLAEAFSWRIATIVVATTIAVATVAFFAFYRDKPSSDAAGQRVPPARMIPQVARDRHILLAVASGTCHSSITGTVIGFLVLFLKEELEISAVAAGRFLAVAMVGGAVGRVGWGMVSDMLLGGRRVETLALLGVLIGASVALLAWLPKDAPLAVVIVLVFFVGSTSLGRSGVYTTLIAELAGPALTGTAVGFSSMIIGVANFGVTPLFGLMADRTGSYDAGWWMLVGIAGMGIVLLGVLRQSLAHSQRA